MRPQTTPHAGALCFDGNARLSVCLSVRLSSFLSVPLFVWQASKCSLLLRLISLSTARAAFVSKQLTREECLCVCMAERESERESEHVGE